MSTITTARHGAAAVTALQRVLLQQRGGDLLSAATVITSTSAQSAYLRKSLAEAGGVAGVEILPLASYVAKLAKAAHPGQHRSPVTPLAYRAAIQAELLAAPGGLVNVASHPSTVERLVGLSLTIRGVPQSDVERMIAAGPQLSADALRIILAAEQRFPAAVSPAAELEIALEALQGRPPGPPVILFAPLPRSPFEGRMVAALGARDDVHIVAALSGVREMDARYRQLLSGWGVQVPVTTEEARLAIRLEVSDPEDEVQAAVREVLIRATSGVPLSAMAILYPDADPYATVCFRQLELAGIPVCGPKPETLASSVAAKLLLRALDLSVTGLDRSAVAGFLNCAPISGPDGASVPAVDWDHLSRRAGVVAADSWEPRLSDFEPWETSYSDGDVDVVLEAGEDPAQLLAFVIDLQARLESLTSQKTWQLLSDWAVGLLSQYLPDSVAWPDTETEARRELAEILTALSELDPILEPATPEVFRSLLVSELEARRSASNLYGSGLLVAPIDAVAGLPFEHVIVLGAAEGTFPVSRREDPLLNDQLRAVGGNYLAPAAHSTTIDAWAISAALAGSAQPGVITHSRSELRSGRARIWPQVLDPLVSEYEVIESHYQGVLSQGRPSSAQDFAIRELLQHVESSEPLASHPLAASDPALSAGLARMRARDAGSLTPHTGLVSGHWLEVENRPFSPTALETYAACPRRYLLARVLRISEQERPEEVTEMSPRDRGSLTHKVLERFVGEAIADGDVPVPENPWTEAQVERLFQISSEEMDAFQKLGLSGGRVQTSVSLRSLNAELKKFVANDNQLRAKYACTPAAVEYGFGFDETPSVFRLADGRKFRVRGSVDRVDTRADGGIVVIDYKTGSSSGYRQFDTNPFDEGRRLQLPIYGSVVSEHFAAAGDSVAMYWMTRDAKQITMDLGESLEEMLDSTIGDLLGGISAGYFPAVPGDVVGYPRVTFENCKYCEFDQVCPQDRQREWSNNHDGNLNLMEQVRSVSGG